MLKNISCLKKQNLKEIIIWIVILVVIILLKLIVKNKIIKYENIILIYYRNEYGTCRGNLKKLCVVQKNGTQSTFEIAQTAVSIGYDSEPINFTSILLDKNPNILIGLTDENKQIIYERYNKKI